MSLWHGLKGRIVRFIAPNTDNVIQHNLAKLCGFGPGDMFGELNPDSARIFTPGFQYDSCGRMLRFFRDEAPESHYARRGGFVLEATAPKKDERIYIWRVDPEISGFVAGFVIEETVKRYNSGERVEIYWPMQAIEQKK